MYCKELMMKPFPVSILHKSALMSTNREIYWTQRDISWLIKAIRWPIVTSLADPGSGLWVEAGI